MDEQNQLVEQVDPRAPSAPPAGNPSRDAVIDKYQQLYGQEQQAEPVAPVTPQVVEPVQAAEQPSAQDQLLMQMAEELKALKQQVVTQNQPPPVEQADWLKLLADGKKAEGEKAMADLIRQQLNLNEIQDQAVNQAVAVLDAKQQIDSFINQVRTAPENADVLVMEPYITAAVARRYDEAMAGGKIKTPADSVAVYKQAVNAELETARNLALSLRGAGKNEAQTRTQQVMASQVIRPNAVNLQREAPTASPEPQVDPTTAYLQERMARQARMHGLTTA